MPKRKRPQFPPLPPSTRSPQHPLHLLHQCLNKPVRILLKQREFSAAVGNAEWLGTRHCEGMPDTGSMATGMPQHIYTEIRQASRRKLSQFVPRTSDSGPVENQTTEENLDSHQDSDNTRDLLELRDTIDELMKTMEGNNSPHPQQPAPVRDETYHESVHHTRSNPPHVQMDDLNFLLQQIEEGNENKAASEGVSSEQLASKTSSAQSPRNPGTESQENLTSRTTKTQHEIIQNSISEINDKHGMQDAGSIISKNASEQKSLPSSNDNSRFPLSVLYAESLVSFDKHHNLLLQNVRQDKWTYEKTFVRESRKKKRKRSRWMRKVECSQVDFMMVRGGSIVSITAVDPT